MPVDIVPVEGALENPVLELQLRLLGFWYVEFKAFCNLDLATVLDEVLNCFEVL